MGSTALSDYLGSVRILCNVLHAVELLKVMHDSIRFSKVALHVSTQVS